MPDLDAEELEEELEDERNFVPREMVGDSRHFTTCELDGADTVDRFLSCPVCLSIMRQPTATECLHRFCSECILDCSLTCSSNFWAVSASESSSVGGSIASVGSSAVKSSR